MSRQENAPACWGSRIRLSCDVLPTFAITAGSQCTAPPRHYEIAHVGVVIFPGSWHSIERFHGVVSFFSLSISATLTTCRSSPIGNGCGTPLLVDGSAFVTAAGEPKDSNDHKDYGDRAAGKEPRAGGSVWQHLQHCSPPSCPWLEGLL